MASLDQMVVSQGPGLGFDPTPQQELTLVARVLARAGYDDYLAGHLTYRQADDTILTNPFSIPWNRLRSSEVCRLDLDGNHLEGPYVSNPAVRLHLEWHNRRDDLMWTCHNHPRWGTIWASVHRIPPCYNQSSALVDPISLVRDYAGQVNDRRVARDVIDAMGDSTVALLGNHGVLVGGTNVGTSNRSPVESRSTTALQGHLRRSRRRAAEGSPVCGQRSAAANASSTLPCWTDLQHPEFVSATGSQSHVVAVIEQSFYGV